MKISERMGRRPCCSKQGLNRGTWTVKEDQILKDYIAAHGEGKWRNLPKLAGLRRCGKSCRLRWLNYLRPNIKRGNISEDEEELIVRLHNLLGNRWSLIAGRLPGRTDNEIKNYWNTTIVKKIQAQQHSKVTLDDTKINQLLSTSCVARPKASRWTNSSPQPNSTQPDTKPVIVQNTNSNAVLQEPCRVDSDMPPQYDLFTRDLESDNRFLSEFLNTEFEPLCDLIDGSKGDANMETDNRFLSEFLNTESAPLCDLIHGSQDDGNMETDLEGGNRFLSDFLNTEFAPICDSVDGSKGDINMEMDPGTCWDMNVAVPSHYDLFTHLDLEMDDKFLSTILDTEFAPLCGLIDGSEGVHDAKISAVNNSWDSIEYVTSIPEPERLG